MLTPQQFDATPVYDLLAAAAQGKIGIDQRWVRSIIDRGPAVVADLVRFGTEDRSLDPISLDEDLTSMFQHFQSPEAVPYFIEYIRRNPEDLPDEIGEALYSIRQAAFEPLLKLYEEMEEDQSGEVAFLLAAFRIRDERVLRLLIDRLEYDITDTAICLSLYGDPAARPALENIRDSVDDEHLKKCLEDALVDIDDETFDEPEPPFDIYELYPEKSGPDTSVLEDEDLLEMLEAEDPEYRIYAAIGFTNRETDDESRARVFEHAKSDPDVAVRANCWEALCGDIAENEEIFKAMLARLEDENAPLIERAGALTGLGQKANEQPIRKYAEQFYENPETRIAALSAMWNSLDRTFSKYFPAHVDDPDPEIRKHAISGVGYLGIYDCAESLRKYFADEEFRPNALFAYALAARTEISPGRIRSLFRRIEDFAGGLTEEEDALVKLALDERLLLHGHKPVFNADEHRHEHGPDCDHEHNDEILPIEPVAAPVKVGRNDPCPCGSGKKYKKCCGG